MALALGTACGGGGERSSPRGGPPGRTPLERFARSDLGQVALCGIGMSSGYAIIMVVKSAVDRPLQLSLRPGTYLVSGDPAAQDMVLQRLEARRDLDQADDIAQACADAARDFEEQPNLEELPPQWTATTTLSLEPGATQAYLLSAYCLDFDKENPGSGTAFSFSRDLAPEIAALFDSLAAFPDSFSVTAIQLATWALNGDYQAAELEEKFEFYKEDQAEACRLLERAGLQPGERKLCQDVAA